MTIKARQFDRLVQKLGLKTRSGDHLLAWFEHDGRIIARTKRSRGSSSDLPMQHSIRQQLKMNEREFRSAVGCTLTREDYLAILREKGLL